MHLIDHQMPSLAVLHALFLLMKPVNLIQPIPVLINLKPAKALGMRTIKVLTEDQALKELSSELDLPLGG